MKQLGSCQVSSEIRGAILALSEAGLSVRQIATQLTKPKSTVQSVLKQYKDTGSLKVKERSGRPRVTTKREDSLLVLNSKKNRKKPATVLTSELNDSRDSNVSLTTVKRRLRSAGLFGRIAAKKPYLKPINQLKRLKWAKAHKDWTKEQWKKVLFTDESKFEIFGSKRRSYVRRMPGERMSMECIQPTVKHGGGSVMVWGCFGGNKTGDLIQIEGIMDKKVYHNVLVRRAVPSGLRLCGKGFTFQQDNDPKHTSHYCMNYLKSKESQKVLKIMTWPPQSPDCNPIELLWDELDRRIRQYSISSKPDLINKINFEWNSIGEETLDKLIERMPRVCQAVLSAKGGWFEESKI